MWSPLSLVGSVVMVALTVILLLELQRTSEDPERQAVTA
jgi:hypothetical protein